MKTVLSNITFFLFVLTLKSQTPLVWANTFGSTNNESANSVFIDSAGSIYVIGNFSNTVDFQQGSGIFNMTAGGNSDAFIVKNDQNGNVVWGKSLEGFSSITPKEIKLDASGNIYIIGVFQDFADFDPGPSEFHLMSNGIEDIFILKLNSLGQFIWAKQIGGAAVDAGMSLSIQNNNLYIAGNFRLTVDFDPDLGVNSLTSAGSSDAFILKLNSAGNFIWVKQLGGSDAEIINSIVVDSVENIFVGGNFYGLVDFDPGSSIYNMNSVGNSDGFLCKYNSAGTLTWAKSVGGIWVDEIRSIVLDDSYSICATGFFRGNVDFDPGFTVFNLSSTGTIDSFVLKLNNSGGFTWAKQLGGTGTTTCKGIDLFADSFNNIYSTGTYKGTTDFDPGSGFYNRPSRGQTDVYISQLSSTGNFVMVETVGGFSHDFVTSIAIDSWHNIYTCGTFVDSADFDPSETENYSISNGNADIFLIKLNETMVSIDDDLQQYNYLISPNPSGGLFNITFPYNIEASTIELYNNLGALIFSQKSAGKQIAIDITDQVKGMYIIKIINDNNFISTYRILKQ
jgi:hypothetical protein